MINLDHLESQIGPYILLHNFLYIVAIEPAIAFQHRQTTSLNSCASHISNTITKPLSCSTHLEQRILTRFIDVWNSLPHPVNNSIQLADSRNTIYTVRRWTFFKICRLPFNFSIFYFSVFLPFHFHFVYSPRLLSFIFSSFWVFLCTVYTAQSPSHCGICQRRTRLMC